MGVGVIEINVKIRGVIESKFLYFYRFSMIFVYLLKLSQILEVHVRVVVHFYHVETAELAVSSFF